MVRRAALFFMGLLSAGVTVHAQTPARAATSAAAQVLPSDVLKKSADAINNPASVVGEGWQEHADEAIARERAVRGDVIRSLADGVPASIQQALAEATKALNLPSALAAASAAAAEGQGQPQGQVRSPGLRYRLYVSQSMGKEGLEQAFAFTAGREDTEMVFRGVKPGQTLYQLQTELMGLIKGKPEGEPSIPNIQVDPTVFSDNAVTVVPTLDKLDPKGRRIATVRGLLDPTWIARETANGSKGDLGAKGTTYPIAEDDLLLKFQEKFTEFDWQKWKDDTTSTYWQKTTFTELPVAREARVRTFDPTVTVPEDIVAPDGMVIARQGDTFNPLKEIGFSQKLVVFDATDAEQLTWARKVLKEAGTTRVTLISVAMDRTAGWEGYIDLENELEHPVFMLNSVVRDSFRVERVPSLVEAKGSVFVITEVPMHHGGSHAVDHTSPR